jgi:hypothetical protein
MPDCFAKLFQRIAAETAQQKEARCEPANNEQREHAPLRAAMLHNLEQFLTFVRQHDICGSSHLEHNRLHIRGASLILPILVDSK